MAASATDIEEFLAGPLVTWLATCVKKPESLQVYDTFFDGGPINEVLLQIDPEPAHPVPTTSNLQGLHITPARIKIFHCIIKNIKAIYEDELGQTIISLPDCVTLGRAPASLAALEQLKLLLLLVLGCAVQGPTKEVFITRIKGLSVDAQHDIVECIRRVTDEQSLVLTLDWTEQPAHRLYNHVRTLTGERDKLLQQWVTDLEQETSTNAVTTINSSDGVESNHLAVELADWKSRLRKQRQELEEKSEILAECKEELEHANNLVAKLKTENADLLTEARLAKAYRDEVDAMKERSERADRLEAEVQRYRERLADAEFYKVRVEELREDNRVLLETREMLETQLARARQRADRVLELEAELLSAKQSINEIALERDAAREKAQEFFEENVQLQQVTKSMLQETIVSNTGAADSENEETNSGENSLSEQLTSNAQARALRLELENRKLLSTIDALKERSFHESANKLLDLEKEKKRLTLKCEQLQENSERLTQQNSELENLFRNAIQENKKLQDSLDTLKVISDRQTQDLQNERVKITELEKNVENLAKEKQRVQTLCDSIKKRADDAEKSLTQMSDQLHNLQGQAEQGRRYEKLGSELKDKVAVLEKENASLQKEVMKFKEFIETKDVTLDHQVEKNMKQEKEILRLTKEYESALQQLEKLQEFEQKAQELILQASVHAGTIATLQKDLVSEKLNNEKFKSSLEKLGLSLDILDNDINIIVEKMLSNPDINKCICSAILKDKDEESTCKACKENKENVQSSSQEAPVDVELSQQCEKLSAEVASLQHMNESLQEENAKMQVDISTLKSQVHSLQSQQTALQLANSQLVAEKEELSKQQQVQNNQHDTLLLDQLTLRTLHEQLTSEYELLKKEEESLKKTNRDLRSEIRSLKENNMGLEKKITTLETEKDALKTDAIVFSNLKAEHNKLKDDFRSLFTASERLRLEYKNIQEELKKLKTESRTLRLGHTEMQGELNSRSDLVAGLQLENAKLQQKCDMLFEMNHSLDSDRRALMDHVSQLLSQYHALLTHSLEDKQHYHLEEKSFTDKINNLCRQKEKLEEKIMEHYRKLDNASAKKKGFGATLVRRVRKAGSDIINKVPTRNRRSWHEDTTRLTQPQFTVGGGSGESNGNDSDNSAADEPVPRTEPFKRSTGGSLHGHKPRDEVALRRSHRDMVAHRNSIAAGEQVYTREPNGALSLGSVGSRRTVYLSEDDSPAVQIAQSTPNHHHSHHHSPVSHLHAYSRSSSNTDPQKTITPKPTIPEESSNKETSTPTPTGDKKKDKEKNEKETAVWYEYGCV